MRPAIVTRRFGIEGGRVVEEVIERRVGRFNPSVSTSISPDGEWSEGDFDSWLDLQIAAAKRAAPAIEAYVKTGTYASFELTPETLQRLVGHPAARAAWGTPAHLTWALANLDRAVLREHFVKVGIPGASVSKTGNVSHQGAETRTDPDTRAVKDWALLPAKATMVLLGDDGTGRDALAQAEAAEINAATGEARLRLVRYAEKRHEERSR